LQICGAHHVVAILELGAWEETAFFHLLLLLCSHHHATLVHAIAKESLGLGLLIPLNLEFGHTRLLNQNMSCEAINQGLIRRVLSEFKLLIVVIYVVSNSEKLLVCV
jgi:hypothetical protein